MQGLQTYHGNPVSDHADRHLDLVGIGRLLSLSYVDDLNALAALRYRSEFGAGEVHAKAFGGEDQGVKTCGSARAPRAAVLRGRCYLREAREPHQQGRNNPQHKAQGELRVRRAL